MPKSKLFDEQEVLHKAMILFWEKGYHNTSIQDLVDRLKINRSSLYNTYGGKKKLFYSAFQLYRSMNDGGLNEFLATQTKAKLALRAMFWKILSDDHSDEDCKGCFIVNTTSELLPDDEHLQNIITQHKTKMEQIFSNILQMGIQSGELNPSIELPTISRLLYTLMSGFRIVGKTKPKLEDSMAEVEAVLSLLN